MDCSEYFKFQTGASGLFFYLIEGHQQLLCYNVAARYPVILEDLEFVNYSGAGLPIFREHIVLVV